MGTRTRFTLIGLASSAMVIALATVALARASQAQTTQPVAKHGQWTAFAHGKGGERLCFVSAQPTKQVPTAAKRDPAYIYVSSWPKEGVAAEVSVKLGYTARKSADVVLTIGKATFKLFTNGERAYVADGAQEQKLVEAMKSGALLTVKATSERGTRTTDTYALSGFAQALQSLATSCK